MELQDVFRSNACGFCSQLAPRAFLVVRSVIKLCVELKLTINLFSGSDAVLIGRTDALQKHGYQEALKRLRAARDAGADVSSVIPNAFTPNLVRQLEW